MSEGGAARGAYRIGVVGVRRGLALARSCQRLANGRLVAIADLVPERLDEAARELGSRWSTPPRGGYVASTSRSRWPPVWRTATR
jgi:hypothetical protein